MKLNFKEIIRCVYSNILHMFFFWSLLFIIWLSDYKSVNKNQSQNTKCKQSADFAISLTRLQCVLLTERDKMFGIRWWLIFSSLSGILLHQGINALRTNAVRRHPNSVGSIRNLNNRPIIGKTSDFIQVNSYIAQSIKYLTIHEIRDLVARAVPESGICLVW